MSSIPHTINVGSSHLFIAFQAIFPISRRGDLLHNIYMVDFWIPLLVGCCIQFIKVIIDSIINKQITRAVLRSAWGFPSVHSWMAASISLLMFLHYGPKSPEFAIAFTFSFLFWYDAANIRYEAWKHALYLNRMREQLIKIVNLDEKVVILKERLWHTFVEVVAWILVWVLITLWVLVVFYGEAPL